MAPERFAKKPPKKDSISTTTADSREDISQIPSVAQQTPHAQAKASRSSGSAEEQLWSAGSSSATSATASQLEEDKLSNINKRQ